MAVSRKGWRTLVVNGAPFVWKATGADHGIVVTVTTANAFHRGPRERQLHFTVPHGAAIVTPAVVQRAIALVALDGDWPGGPGNSDLRLPHWAARAISVDTPRSRLSDSISHVAQSFESRNAARSAWLRADALLDLGALLVFDEALFDDPELAQWSKSVTCEASIAAAQELVSAAEATLNRGQQFRYSAYCYRSAAEWIIDLARSELRSTIRDSVTTSPLDVRLQAGAPVRANAPRQWLLPISHRWWRWAPAR